jgi:hypothetical protein
MKAPHSIYALFLVVPCGCTGCLTVHDSCGGAKNLKSRAEVLPPGTRLEMRVTSYGATRSGQRYVAFGLRSEKCSLVLFHPYADTNNTFWGTTSSGDAAAWLVREKKPDCAALARDGRNAAFLSARAERLHGTITGLWYAKSSFNIIVELVSESDDTSFDTQFAGYTTLWSPFVVVLLFLGFG